MEDIKAIDVMNHPGEAVQDAETMANQFDLKEYQIMARTTFKTVFRGYIPKPEEIKSLMASAPLVGHASVEDMIKDMDELGYDKIVIVATKFWSYRYHLDYLANFSIDLVGEIVQKAKGRVIGGACYDPLHIEDSLKDVERGVKEYGFKYVWFHPLSWGLSPRDKKFYPLYAKCCELGIAVGMQVGQSAEVLPSWHGQPMEVDEVAIDFPDLRINLSHTGWPWTAEFCSMIWRHPNVYGDISAYYPHGLDPELIRFMDSSRGRDKVMFGTNGLGLKRCKEELMALPLKDESKRMILRDNALRFFEMDG